jgi:DNA (cytosine-5)-methyltransferase 1
LSVAGLQAGISEGTRSGLLWECKKIIDAKKPKYLLLENVPALVGKKFLPDFNRWVDYLTSIGYNTYWKILNAKDYGVPQSRNRVFAVSILKEFDTHEFTFINPSVPVPFIAVKEIDAPEYLYHVCPSMLKAIENGKCKVIDDTGIASCLTTKQQRWNNGGFVKGKNGALRYLSGLEQMRLMGFSDADYNAIKDFRITRIDKLCGNSIVVKVLESIFRSLIR